MFFPIICISLLSPVTGLWLNWLCRPLLRSDKEKKKKNYQNIQHCKFGHFIILSVVVDHNVLCFSCTKQKNFKYVKMNVLENEKYNVIVLMASAVSWTLQGEKWGSCLQSFIRWCSLPVYHTTPPFSHRHLLFPPIQHLPFWRTGPAACSGLEDT